MCRSLTAAAWFSERRSLGAAAPGATPAMQQRSRRIHRQAAERYLARALRADPAAAEAALRLARLDVAAGRDAEARTRLTAVLVRPGLRVAGGLRRSAALGRHPRTSGRCGRGRAQLSRGAGSRRGGTVGSGRLGQPAPSVWRCSRPQGRSSRRWTRPPLGGSATTRGPTISWAICQSGTRFSKTCATRCGGEAVAHASAGPARRVSAGAGGGPACRPDVPRRSGRGPRRRARHAWRPSGTGTDGRGLRAPRQRRAARRRRGPGSRTCRSP